MYLGLLDSIFHWATYTPDRVALREIQREYTFLELREKSLLFAGEIGGHSCKQVGIFSRSPATIVATILAAEYTGITVVVLNPDISRDAIFQNILDVGVNLVIVDERSPLLPKEVTQIVGSSTLQMRKVSRVKKHGPQSLSENWGVLFSSGSTGVPKAISHTYYSIWTELLCWIFELPLTRGDVFLIGRPLYYTGGLVLSLATLLVGGTVITSAFLDPNNPSEVHELIKVRCDRSSCSLAFFTPGIAMALAARMNDQEAKNYFPRMLLMGAPAPHDIKLQLSKKFNVELIESWGNSEGLGTISFPADWQCRLGTVGRPFVSEHISIVDDHGRDLGVGEVGRVAGLDESYFTEYCSRPEATEAAKVDGFVISDDLGYQDADGYLYLKGRRQQSFVFNENTFFSLELENEIIGSKLVSECAVIPSFSEEENGNIMLRIFVVPIPGNDETDIIFQISGMVGDRTGIPASELVILVRQFLPKTPSGKVDLATLSKNDP